MDLLPSHHLTISQVTTYIRDLLDGDVVLQDLWLAGEVSNYRRAASGHVYLTLKDAESQISCVMWRSWAGRQAYLPREGEQVLAHGHVSVYTVSGAYQFYMDAVQPLGIGQLYLEFEALKERLAGEGLFDPSRKRSLPVLPTHIGVVTSASGAALRDILNVLARRYPLGHVILSASLVQGAQAPPQIVAALRALYAMPEVEVIILARGGGSLEDLWPFNDERVARAIYESPAPVVSGVGHETDYTIADFVADARAPTPSAAAEMVAPDREALCGELAAFQGRLIQLTREECGGARAELAELRLALLHHSPERVLMQHRQRLDDQVQRIVTHTRHRLELLRAQLAGQSTHLGSLSPAASLERGYAIVRRADDGAIVRRLAQIAAGDGLSVQVSDGRFGARVEAAPADDQSAP